MLLPDIVRTDNATDTGVIPFGNLGQGSLTKDKANLYRQLDEGARLFLPKMHTFSDSIVIYVPLSDEGGDIYIDGLFSTLLSIAGAFLRMKGDRQTIHMLNLHWRNQVIDET